jgi:hypothetical protein
VRKHIWNPPGPLDWTLDRAAYWGYFFALLNQHCVLRFQLYARHLEQEPGRPLEQRQQLRQMLSMLSNIGWLFRRPGPVAYSDLPLYQQALERCILIGSDLALWGSNEPAITIIEEFLKVAPDQDSFRDLITVALLDGKANWTEARTPLLYTGEAIEYQHRDQARQRSQDRYRFRPLSVALEYQAEDKAEDVQNAGVDLGDVRDLLLADTHGDTRRYGEKALEGFELPEIRQLLHWGRERARQAARAWAAHLYRASGSLPVREALGQLNADASRTVVRRTFFDPTHRSRLRYWNFKIPPG